MLTVAQRFANQDNQRRKTLSSRRSRKRAQNETVELFAKTIRTFIAIHDPPIAFTQGLWKLAFAAQDTKSILTTDEMCTQGRTLMQNWRQEK